MCYRCMDRICFHAGSTRSRWLAVLASWVCWHRCRLETVTIMKNKKTSPSPSCTSHACSAGVHEAGGGRAKVFDGIRTQKLALPSGGRWIALEPSVLAKLEKCCLCWFDNSVYTFEGFSCIGTYRSHNRVLSTETCETVRVGAPKLPFAVPRSSA